MKYLLLIEDGGQWYACTKDEKLVVTENLNFWANKDMPAIGYHPKTTIPVFDIDAELADIYRELDESAAPISPPPAPHTPPRPANYRPYA